VSLIKLIESVGILLGVPLSKKKSPYKALLPSNYDDTLLVLNRDFYGCLNKLTEMQSGVIEHDVATNFYNKMLEPGFDYEDALINGGLIVRELYNAAFLVLLKLQSDGDRVPVGIDNILLLMDGSRASYCAFDVASHIHRHGSMHVGMDFRHADPQLAQYLGVDIRRRCVSQYKIPEHCFDLHDLEITAPENQATASELQFQSITNIGSGSILPALQNLVHQEKISVMAIPISRPQEFDFPYSKKEPVLDWALSSSFLGDVVLVHANSWKRNFSEVEAPRTHLLYIPYNLPPNAIFLRALRFCRPGDSLCIVSVFPSRKPEGENRDTRFDFGSRHSWHSDEDVKGRDRNPQSTSVGWNDSLVENFQSSIEEMLQKSAGVSGFVRIERIDSANSSSSLVENLAVSGEGETSDFLGQKSLTEKLMRVAVEEQCSSIIFFFGSDMTDPTYDEPEALTQALSPTRNSTASMAQDSMSAIKSAPELKSIRNREKILRGLLQQAYSGRTSLVLLK
jgi:hypothetical protein